MKVTYKTLIRTSVALASLCAGSQAFAADAPESDSASVADTDIIVSARRIEERLQDVPISITVVDQDRLNTANIVSAQDLSSVVPGLAVQSRYSAENANFAIRGFSQELRTTASVGTYFAEVVAPRGGGISLSGGDGAGPGSLFDLQNVQVLKGPQGTLFGRNTTGGAVLLVPRKPTDKLEGYVEGTYGNFNAFRIQGVVNVPLAPWARVRLGVDRMTRDGYLHNGSPIGPRDFADVDYVAARGSLVLDLAPDLENYTIVSFTNSDNHGSPGQVYVAGTALAGPQFQPVVARLIASGDPYYIETKLANSRIRTKQWQVINKTAWQASDNITIKNIFSYSEFRQVMRQDIFSGFTPHPLSGRTVPISATASLTFPNDLILMTPYSFSGGVGASNDQHNLTEELQIQGVTGNGKLNYQFGVYYEHSTPGGLTESISPDFGSACSSAPFESLETLRCLPASVFTGNTGRVNHGLGTLEFINLASYAQATYAVTEKLKLTGGIRLTWDRTRGTSSGKQYGFVSPAPNVYGVATLIGCQAEYARFGPTCQATEAFLNTSTTKPTWTLSAAYQPTESTNLYASYSRGYRQGSTTPFALSFRPSFGPETVDSFELGAKASFRGAISGYLNIAAFYSKIRGQQLQIGLRSFDGQTGTSIFNAGASRMYGIDIDASLKFSDYFRVSGAMTYVNSRVTQLDPTLISTLRTQTAPGNPSQLFWTTIAPSAVEGDQLPYTPELSFNIHPVVTLPAPERIGTIELGATYRYVSATPTGSTISNPRSDVNATRVSQIDLNLDWKGIGGSPVDVSLFATNVTDQFTATLQQPIIDGFGFDMRYIGMPRMYGARLRVSF